MKYKSLSFIFCMLLGHLVCQVAQAASANVHFTALAESGSIEDIFYDSASDAGIELKARDFIRSEFYKAKRLEPLEIYRLVPPEANEVGLQREVLATLAWPEGDGPFLLLIAQRGDQYGFSIAPDGVSTFPFGSFRFVNASRQVVIVKVGDVVSRLEPQQSQILKPDLDSNPRGVTVQMAAQVGEPQIVYSSLWNGSEKMRTLAFIVNRDSARRPVGLKVLHENSLVHGRKLERKP